MIFVAALRVLRPTDGQGRVFRFHQGGHLKHMLMRAKLAALGLPCPVQSKAGLSRSAAPSRRYRAR